MRKVSINISLNSIPNLESNMENPADVYTTGIPMSVKGNFDHNKYGSDEGDTVDIVSDIKLEDHDYPNNSHIVLRDSSCDNVEFINNSIQDGFQSEILCSFACDAGLQSDVPMADSSSLEIESVSESDTHINFTDSPGTSFTEKIESFSSMEGLVPGFDEQLDSYLLSGFKSDTKSPSEDGDHELETEQRNVTEAICDIAKSFGLEDLLPDTFQVDGGKDGLCVTVSTDDLCGNNHENIGELSLEDFGKCPDLHSPASSLNLDEQLDSENYVLSGLEMITPRSKSFENCINSRPPLLLKDDQSKSFLNSKTEFTSNEISSSSEVKELQESDLKNVNSLENISEPAEYSVVSTNYENQENVCNITEDLVSDIPTVSISDVHIENSFSETDQNYHGSVRVNTDKASNKMQIVLTLEQGQQIFDIQTESVDASQEPLDLDFQTTFAEDKVSDALQSTDVEQPVVSSPVNQDISNTHTNEEVSKNLLENTFIEFVSPVPKGKKSKTWVCPIEDCGQVLDKECKLRVHMINHKGARPFKCNFEGCDWAFTTPYRLRRHVETHLGCKDYVCDFEGCNRKFTTVYNLKTHKKRHKWPNSLTCPSKDCKMSFANRRKMELHLRVHKDVEAPYKCSLCGKQYYSANCIASHYRTHQYNEDDFKCPFAGCGKVYDKICRLRQHIRHHTGERPYSCPAEGCKWSFMSASKLTRHMRKHTGERKFVCTEPGCGKSFMRPEHLQGHIVIHSGDKPFHCPHENCNARFTAKSSLYVHVKKHCPSVLKVVYPCPVESCIKKYNSKATLKQHLQKIHPETLQDGKAVNISEKLELTMPVSVVNSGSDNSLKFFELDEILTDDPAPDLQVQLLQASQQSSISLNSGPVIVNSTNSVTVKSVPKTSKSSTTQNRTAQSNTTHKETLKGQKGHQSSSKSSKLIHINHSGCARTDYSYNYTPKKIEPETSLMYLNQNSSDNESKNFLNNHLSTDIKSPDIMLTSSIIYDNPPEQLIKNHFLSDNSSASHSLYTEDSILVSSSTFGTELIPVSLLSDDADSDESILNHNSSGIVFSEQNSVDAFSESMHLHDLD